MAGYSPQKFHQKPLARDFVGRLLSIMLTDAKHLGSSYPASHSAA